MAVPAQGPPPASSPASPMRERILRAASEVLAERGVLKATTKEIARVAGVSEGSLYNHFANKSDLFAGVFAELNGGIADDMATLVDAAGTGSLTTNLTAAARAAIEFYTRLLPMTGPLLVDRAVTAWLRDSGRSAGPLAANTSLTSYLQAEQRGGRLRWATEPAVLASALLGGCHLYAYLMLTAGQEAVATVTGLPADADQYANALARSLLEDRHE